MKLAILAIVLCSASVARADDWTGGLEAGAEADSNVQRVEVGPDGSEAPIAAGLVRVGGRAAGRGATRYGSWTLDGLGLLRAVADPGDVSGEDVAVVAGDARWDVAIPHRAARAFVRGDLYDVLGLGEAIGARTFTSRGAEAGVVALDGERRLTIAGGARDFTYKPDHDFDWSGATMGVRVDAPLWRGGGDEPRALELATEYRLERRRFTGLAFADGCMPGATPMPSCYVPTTARRADLHHRGLVQLTYTGERVLSAGYELLVSDSTSYGESVIRHRVLASATSEVGWQTIATVSAIVEVDRYQAPLLVARDINSQTFSSIDDDNRNMLSILVARPLAHGVSVEARWAYWLDAFSSDAYRYRRQDFYLGLVWGQAH